MNDWKETTLGMLVNIKYGKDHKHLSDGNYPLYGSGGIMRYVEKPLYEEESILIPRKGTLTNLFYVDEPFWSVDTIFYTEIDVRKSYPKFLFYKLKTMNLGDLNVGSAVPSLTTNVLNAVELNLPPLPEQKAIANALTAFDDKIELLQQQNTTLETLAQTIFQEWFGKYQLGDELPEGWRIGKLGDVVKKSNTGADAIQKAPIVDEDTGIKCLRIGDLSNNRNFDYWGFCKVNDRNFKQFQLKKFDIVITRTSILGLNIMILENLEAVYNNGLIKISLKKEFAPFFIYAFFKSQYYRDYISMINNDTSTRPNMKIDYLLKFPIILPTLDIQTKYSNLFESFLNKVSMNNSQIQSLIKTRDALLLKLMSGQVRVKM